MRVCLKTALESIFHINRKYGKRSINQRKNTKKTKIYGCYFRRIIKRQC